MDSVAIEVQRDEKTVLLGQSWEVSWHMWHRRHLLVEEWVTDEKREDLPEEWYKPRELLKHVWW